MARTKKPSTAYKRAISKPANRKAPGHAAPKAPPSLESLNLFWEDLDATLDLPAAYAEVTERFWVEADEMDGDSCILYSRPVEEKKKGARQVTDDTLIVAEGGTTAARVCGRFSIHYMWVLHALIAQLIVGWFRAFNKEGFNVAPSLQRRGKKRSAKQKNDIRLLGAILVDHAWKVRGSFTANAMV